MKRTPRSSRLFPGGYLFLAATFAAFPGGTQMLRAADLLQPANDEENLVVEKSKPAIVQVHSGDGNVTLAGTGFFIDDKGTVLTSSAVIGDNTNAHIVFNGQELPARIVGNDQRSGVAMLKVALTGTPSLPTGQTTDLKTGYSVTAMGFPLNLPVAPLQGQVSGFEVHYLKKFFLTTNIHVAVPLSPGQVGGPLLNNKGEVLGLVGPSPDDGRSIYVLPIEAVMKTISDFTQYGRARHGWVGVNVVETEDTLHDGRTVRVVQTVPNTPASRSGILAGDTVMRIDSREVYRPADVLDASFFSHVGGNMTVVVRRDDALYNYTFAVIERPSTPPPSNHPAPATTMQTPHSAGTMVSMH